MKINTLMLRLRTPAWGTILAALYTIVLMVRMHTQYTATDLGLLAGACLIELTVIDLLTKAALGIGPVVIRAPALLVPAALGVVYTAQVYSTWISGGFIPPIAFANREVTGLISFRGAYLMLGGFLAAFTGYVLWRGKTARLRPTAAMFAGLATLAVAYIALIHGQPLARGIVIVRGEAPVSSFFHSVAMYGGLSSRTRLDSTQLSAVRASFNRRQVYETGFPKAITHTLPKRPNVIVVFTEGMSARWINAYGGVNPGLSPNLDRLADRSLLFTNYFNHTAATFRGLRGQLTSGHQEIDGFNQEGNGIGQRDVSGDIIAVSRISVPEILRAHGYRSMFFLSQEEYLNKMIDTLGFDRTLGRDYLYDRHLRKPGEGPPAYLSDPQLFDATLAELEALPADKPFFAAIYNFQTHAFMDGELEYGNGDNQMLNRFHTYDRDVGRFIQRFMASRLHENTVLVFTSDHSTFPDPYAVKADPQIPRYFVDTIPLMIYWKGVGHRSIDLGGKNSLDLAPSLLSLLDVGQDTHNLFLGCTFFEQCALDRISNIGSEYILTAPGRSYSEALVPEAQRAAYDEGKETIERYKAMDLIIDTRQ